MKTELLKVHAMPTARWCVLAVAFCGLLGFVSIWFWGPGPGLEAIQITVGFPLAVVSIVFGVWIFGVEYGQNTMRRALTADPGRLKLFVVKLAVALLLIAVGPAIAYLVALPFFDVATERHRDGIPLAEYRDMALASLISNLVYVIIGASLALITASMAGGVTAALVFVFILDLFIGAIPHVGDFSLGVALSDLLAAVYEAGEGVVALDTGHSTAEAGLILAAWLLVLAGLGLLRFSRSDVK